MSAEDSFAEAALAAQQVSLILLAKLVEKAVISPRDAAEVLETVRVTLEGYQLSFPVEYHPAFDDLCDHLSELITSYRAMRRRQP